MTNNQIVASLSGTLVGASVFPVYAATIVAINDAANTLTLSYSYQGNNTTFTWYVLGFDGDSVLLSSSSKDVADAVSAGNGGSLNLQTVSLTGDDLVDYSIGATPTWSAFSTPISVSSAVAAFQAGSWTPWTAISDSAQDVQAALDTIQQMVAAGDVGLIALTDSGTPTIALSAAQLANDMSALNVIASPYQLSVTGAAAANVAAIFQSDSYVVSVAVTDSAANVAANLDSLQVYAGQGAIQSISLTDGGTPTLSLSEAQFFNDPTALSLISGPYQLSLTATAAGDVAWLFSHESAVASVAVTDSAANVSANLDSLQPYAGNGEILSIGLTDGGTPVIGLSETQLTTDAAVLTLISSPYDLSVGGAAAADVAPLFNTNSKIVSIAVTDSAADVLSNLTTLAYYANNNQIVSITLTDGGTPALSITDTQSATDAAALAAITGDFTVSIQVTGASQSVVGVAGHETTALFSGNADQYSVTPAGDGVTFTITGNGVTDTVSNVTALQFSDFTDIVASQSPPVAGAVSSAQITELYGAVFGRIPDAAGLTFYQNYAAANPSTPFLQYAQWFLASPEYIDNPSHNYAQTVSGDEQFITDSYTNLLHRTPTAAEIAYYENNVIAPALVGLAAGSTAYVAADNRAHAQTLVYFSQSPEFLGDVQITSQNHADAQHWLILV